jgi:glycosyltransferase involved in cell wall biosynthesis
MKSNEKGLNHALSRGGSTDRERPLRVCLFTYRGNPTSGGQGVYIKRLSKALSDLGHKVDVASGPPYPVLDEGITLHRIPSLDLYNPQDLFRVPRLQELKSPVNLMEWLGVSSGGFPEPFTSGLHVWDFMRKNAHNYDIFHDNQCLAYGILGVKATGIPTIATIHHPITVDRDVEVKSMNVWWKRLKVRRWYSFINMQIRVSRRLSHIITVSEASTEDISKELPYAAQVQGGGQRHQHRHLPSRGRGEARGKQDLVTNSADSPIKGCATSSRP